MSDAFTPAKRLQAFLSLIAWAEGTSAHPLTQQDGYDVVAAHSEAPFIVADLCCHPFTNILKDASRLPSSYAALDTRAGRYQLHIEQWQHLAKRCTSPSFSPRCQDRAATLLLNDCDALPHLYDGNLNRAAERASRFWLSLDTGFFGPQTHTQDALIDNYNRFISNPSD